MCSVLNSATMSVPQRSFCKTSVFCYTYYSIRARVVVQGEEMLLLPNRLILIHRIREFEPDVLLGGPLVGRAYFLKSIIDVGRAGLHRPNRVGRESYSSTYLYLVLSFRPSWEGLGIPAHLSKGVSLLVDCDIDTTAYEGNC